MEQPETPVLTVKQQRTALSGKKNKNRDRCGHTVFTSPYSSYWLVYLIFVCLFSEDINYALDELCYLESLLNKRKIFNICLNWTST